MKFTIPGGNGFIGSHLARRLQAQGITVDIPPRDAAELKGNLGHVIYAIGLTGNFRQRPGDTVEAHVGALQKLLEGASFDSWLYLSSTRVYSGLPADAIAEEESELRVKPDADSLYNLSKLLGEAICLSAKNQNVRIARLSNVYGSGQSPHTFLGAVRDEIAKTGRVVFHEAPDSSKDYISVEDAARLLQDIALRGREKIYNVASGRPVTHKMLADRIIACGHATQFSPQARMRAFPAISTARADAEFGKAAGDILKDLPDLLKGDRI